MLGLYNTISMFQPSDKAIAYAGPGGQGVIRSQKSHQSMDHRRLMQKQKQILQTVNSTPSQMKKNQKKIDKKF